MSRSGPQFAFLELDEIEVNYVSIEMVIKLHFRVFPNSIALNHD